MTRAEAEALLERTADAPAGPWGESEHGRVISYATYNCLFMAVWQPNTAGYPEQSTFEEAVALAALAPSLRSALAASLERERGREEEIARLRALLAEAHDILRTARPGMNVVLDGDRFRCRGCGAVTGYRSECVGRVWRTREDPPLEHCVGCLADRIDRAVAGKP